jgi:hypothetical protein
MMELAWQAERSPAEAEKKPAHGKDAREREEPSRRREAARGLVVYVRVAAHTHQSTMRSGDTFQIVSAAKPIPAITASRGAWTAETQTGS